MATTFLRQSSLPETTPSGTNQLTLGMTLPMAYTLGLLSEKMGVSVEEVLSQAVALLRVAVEAQDRDQRLCLADDDLNIVSEIVDFGTSREPLGVDPSPEPGKDRPSS